jgi:hypothetical protein
MREMNLLPVRVPMLIMAVRFPSYKFCKPSAPSEASERGHLNHGFYNNTAADFIAFHDDDVYRRFTFNIDLLTLGDAPCICVAVPTVALPFVSPG